MNYHTNIRQIVNKYNNNADMEVTKSNFEQVLKKLPEIFERAQFICLDTEFTGLKIDGAARYNYFDTLNIYYETMKERIQKFLAIQIGLSAFIYDSKKDRYSHEAFNFYIFPANDSNFLCQVSSIYFLAQHGFDFNKLFLEGIPYMRDDETATALKKLKDRFDKSEQQQKFSTDIAVRPEQKRMINDILTKVENFLNDHKVELNLPRMTSFMRMLAINSIRKKFGDEVYVEPNRDETLTVFKGLNSEMIKNRRQEKYELDQKDILQQVGFSQVIKLLVNSRKPIVGHNFGIDLLYTIHQFLEPIPDDLEQFRQLANFLFPCVIDTKILATSDVFQGQFESNLNTMVTYFEEFGQLPEIDPGLETPSYSLDKQQPHVAAYDAFLTGACFLALTKKIGEKKKASLNPDLANTPFLKDFINKLSSPRLHEISCIDLANPNATPNRSNVFHVTFPSTWKREDLLNHFKDFGHINIGWIDDTSAFIGISKNLENKFKQKVLNRKSDIKVRSYNDFRKSQNPQKPKKIRSEEALKPSEEDLGTVVKRFEVPDFE